MGMSLLFQSLGKRKSQGDIGSYLDILWIAMQLDFPFARYEDVLDLGGWDLIISRSEAKAVGIRRRI